MTGPLLGLGILALFLSGAGFAVDDDGPAWWLLVVGVGFSASALVLLLLGR